MSLGNTAWDLIEAELTSAEPERALDAINSDRIPLYHVAFLGGLTVRFRVRRLDYPRVRALALQKGDSLRITKRLGIYWSIKALKNRKLLISGLLLLLFLTWILPTRVLFVRVEGNVAVPTRKILSSAEDCGIRFWASRREVRSEKVKNALLSAVPELQWAGVNTRGCVAWISVRERMGQTEHKEKSGISGIVAARDGIIDSCAVTRGNLLCSPGQAVQSGQVLISGYTDCGLYLQATRAEGEIYAITKRDLNVIAPFSANAVRETGEVGHKYSLLIGKKRINLWKDSGISDRTCGRIYSEYYVTLPGGFRLPLALAVESFFQRETEEPQQTADASALSEFARKYLLEQMIAGQIRVSRLSYSEDAGFARLTGSCICREMIGRVQPEQIGE